MAKPRSARDQDETYSIGRWEATQPMPEDSSITSFLARTRNRVWSNESDFRDYTRRRGDLDALIYWQTQPSSAFAVSNPPFRDWADMANMTRDSGDWTAAAGVPTSGVLDSLIDRQTQPPVAFTNSNPRFRDWVEFTRIAQTIQDPRERAEAVNAWVNTAITYNYAKVANLQVWHAQAPWLQTPQMTLAMGSGVCIDTALLKYETLLRVGFKPEDIQLLRVDVRSPGQQGVTPHAVTTVRINGQTWVLDNQQSNRPFETRFLQDAALIPFEDFFRPEGSPNIFGRSEIRTPIDAIDGNGRMRVWQANTSQNARTTRSQGIPQGTIAAHINDANIRRIMALAFHASLGNSLIRETTVDRAAEILARTIAARRAQAPRRRAAHRLRGPESPPAPAATTRATVAPVHRQNTGRHRPRSSAVSPH